MWFIMERTSKAKGNGQWAMGNGQKAKGQKAKRQKGCTTPILTFAF